MRLSERISGLPVRKESATPPYHEEADSAERGRSASEFARAERQIADRGEDFGIKNLVACCGVRERCWAYKINKHHKGMRYQHSTIRSRLLQSGAPIEAEDSRTGRFRSLGVFSAVFLFLSVIGYLFSVNRNAVSGYSMRITEKRMMELSSEAQKLRIQEAELRSLYGLEAASGRLDMKPIEGAISLDAPGPVAFR